MLEVNFHAKSVFLSCLFGVDMVFRKQMFFLKYIIGLRQRSVVDEEKPFLSHLDDLRKTIFKILGTLIVAMILCFNFSGMILNFLRAPVERVWVGYERNHLPSEISPEEWLKAKKLAEALPGLPEQAQEALKARESKEVRNLSEAALLLRAMRTLPPKQQEEFLKEATAPATEMAELVQRLDKVKALMQVGDGASGVKMMSALQPTEAFNLSLKLAFYAGIIVSFPLLLMFILEFIIPGLREKEKKVLFTSMAVGFGLFLTGASFAYFMVLPQILDFFFSYSMELGIANDWRIGFYLSFTLQFVMLFGLSFELPVIVMPFVKLGILNYDMMKASRRYAVIIIALLSAVLTPQDVLSMLMMAVPMYLLYEICIFLAWREQKRVQREEAEENQRVAKEWTEGQTVYQSQGHDAEAPSAEEIGERIAGESEQDKP